MLVFASVAWYDFRVLYTSATTARAWNPGHDQSVQAAKRKVRASWIMTERIGFVGVGRMGANMARRLKECGCEIAVVYDLNTANAQSLAQELGCPAADRL